MLQTTTDIFKAGLKADPTITPTERARLLAILRTGATPAPSPVPASPPAPRLLRRKEVASRLSVCLRTVDTLPIRKIILPGRTRAAGFLESEVNALIQQAA